ncbi:MAG: hypothetical protein NT164_05165 [Verrucomicrobiae bacterium]|nr:hypothetical protein [Verrucomicrobiae bacterium]
MNKTLASLLLFLSLVDLPSVATAAPEGHSEAKDIVIPSPQNKWTIRRWKFGVEQGGRVQRYANITPDLTTKLSAKITSQMVQLF